MDVPETERKYEVAQGFTLPSLAEALVNSARIEQEAPIELDATYFDTDDHRLVRGGVTLRRRTGGDDAGWHLKVPELRRHTRLEIRRPLQSGTLTEVPSELADFVLARTRGKSLRQVAEIRTTRTMSKIVGPGTEPIVVVADDAVKGHMAGGVAGRAWREVEVEVEPGGEGIAKRIGKVLRSAGARESAEGSKLAAVLGVVDDEAPIGDALRSRLVSQAREVALSDLDVRRDQPDGVHDLRVATRRLRGCLRSFEAVFEANSTEPLAAELRWLAGSLGKVRDLQVLEEQLDASMETHLPVAERSRVREVLHRHLEADLRDARHELDEVLRSERYVHLLDMLDHFVSRPPYRSGRPPCRRQLLQGLRGERRRVRRKMRKGERAEDRDRDLRLHDARKAAKWARYAAETVALLARRSRRVAAQYEEVQDLLGERQDAVVARTFLEGLALDVDRETTAGVRFFLGILWAAEARRVTDVDRSLQREGRRLTSMK